MPPRPPPPPGALTILCSLGALIAAWALTAIEAAVRGAAAALAGVPFEGLRVATEPPWLVSPVLGSSDGLAAGTTAAVLLSGTVILIITALAGHFALGVFRAGGVTRALALEGAVLALLWLPTVLVAAALPGGGGPAGELYRRLGAPQAGRGAAAALGVFLLAWLAGVAASRSIAVGRAWMRVDALEFRRRLVGVVAGVPAAVAMGALMVGAGWAAPAWAVGWALVILVTLRMRTA